MARLDADLAAARSAARTQLVDLPTSAGIVVACSGGADSLALAAAVGFAAPRQGLRAFAVIVDHGLQVGSADVAAHAAEQCRSLGLTAHVRAVQVPRTGAGPEADARTARYAELETVRAELGAAAILTGHTLDDQAESVLLGLGRGAGARSLAGMAPVRGFVRRPFLGLLRECTEGVCRALGLDFWQDPTNGVTPVPTAGDGGPADRAFPLRSQVRTRALPVLEDVLGPGTRSALARTADLLRQDADYLDAQAAELLARARCADAGGTVRGADSASLAIDLDVAVLARAHPALRHRALRAAAVEIGVPAGGLYARHIQAIDALVVRWRGQGPTWLPGARIARRRCGTISLGPPAPSKE